MPTPELLDVTMNGKSHAMTLHDLNNSLLYASYRYNRQRSPQFTPSEWAAIFPNVEALEAQYQRDINGL